MARSASVARWKDPMRVHSLPGTGPWTWLEPGLWVYRSRELDLIGEADALLAEAAPAVSTGGAARLATKRRMHAAGVGAATAPASAGGGGHRFVVQVAIQFLAGYHDLGLRDAAQVGHGAILCADPDWHGRPEVAAVVRGALIGLATTEPARESAVDGSLDEPADGPTDGTDVGAVTTRATRTAGGGGWRITGRKTWVSRVLEADAFVVFARSPEHLSAFYVPAGAPGMTAIVNYPAGRSGWSSGDLLLDSVAVPASARLGTAVGGVAVFRRHFAEYRPLIAATCLGAAAAAVDSWVEVALAEVGDGRTVPGDIVERLGDLRGKVLLALGGLLTGAGRPGGIDGSWSKMVRARGVRTAIEVVREVAAALADTGAVGERAHWVLTELTAFEHGDGSTEPLLRSAGERFLRYSAAILDEISEPTSVLPRPRLSD
jgi:alkylation response protein AidB-like acyl-CoA dehydrogenase